MKLAVAFAALVSVFTFSSCLDSGESGPNNGYAIVTVGNNMGIPYFLADFFPNIKLYPNVNDLSVYGIPANAKRAAITYTLPEGTVITENTTKLDITLIAGGCSGITVDEISNRPDTCSAYTSKIQSFVSGYPWGYIAYPAAYAENGYLNLMYEYLTGSKRASSVLLDNRASNDTLYLDLKIKADGENKKVADFKNFALNTSSLLNKVMPQKDSIYVTVVSESSKGGSEGKDSITTRCKRIFY
ncbi:hypothetical protein [Phocaeicola sp.]